MNSHASAPQARIGPAQPFAERRRGGGLWGLAFRRLRRNRLALAGLGLIAVFAMAGLLAPLIAPFDPARQNLHETFAHPSLHHLMGTDNLGRDWFSRLLYGARLSLSVGVLAQLVIVGIGIPIGLVAGYRGGLTDSLLMRLTDLVYAFPDLLLIILLRSVMGGSLVTLFLIIGIVSWVDLARLVRGQVLSLKEREYVAAARSLGARDYEIMVRHLLPNLLGPVTVIVAFGVPRAIFVEATLSFIGIGASAGTPSWGTMVQEGYSAIFSFPFLVIFPSLAIALVMLAFTFLGDGLRDALDPTAETYSPQMSSEPELRRPVPTSREDEAERERAA